MRKWLFIAAIAILGSDIAIDAFSLECKERVCTTACHSTVCQNHFVNPKVSVSKVIDNNRHNVAIVDSRVPKELFDKSVFHPPEVLA